MDHQVHEDRRPNVSPTLPVDGYDTSSSLRYAGSFFPDAKHFVLTGGKFTSITNITQSAYHDPSDFRVIPLGDLDLRQEIRLDGTSGIVHRRNGRASVRRMYSARIRGINSKMTVAIYQGENSEEEWREDISQHLNLRHPNLVQLCGISSSSGLHAAIFYDDLIPCKNLLSKHKDSPVWMVHFFNYLEKELYTVAQYMDSISSTPASQLFDKCIYWLRPSTGRLCIELTPKYPPPHPLPFYWLLRDEEVHVSLLGPDQETEIISSMLFDHYHEICRYHLDHPREFLVPFHSSISLGEIRHFSKSAAGYEQTVAIAFIPFRYFDDWSWSGTREMAVIAENGWIRINAVDVASEYSLRIYINFRSDTFKGSDPWLTQANYIFDQLNITSNHEDYVRIRGIQYVVTLSEKSQIVPHGYLFLCPLEELQSSDDGRFFRVPNCVAYWSLNPSGAERLSPKDAKDLGFQSIGFVAKASGKSWDRSVYAGLRQFHQGKGYDPCSQDLARELGYPLYQFGETQLPFTRSRTGEGEIEEYDFDFDETGLEVKCAASKFWILKKPSTGVGTLSWL
ncbi:hypothetical protein GGX14DRAFT_485662 [Mycena pura]|uniref:Uncharacterized protein n=1 Tax=Mycena pura TaxID=153505 RepID=A0AAD6UJF4_9AGAR|nr:hypothetical protein GGX14DRAFT_485662 [Mycena pura]